MLVYSFTAHTNLKESIYISMGSEYMSVDFTHPKKYMGKIYLSQIKQNPWKTNGLNGASIEAFFEPFREMNIEELYATALQMQDFFDRYPHMKRELY